MRNIPDLKAENERRKDFLAVLKKSWPQHMQKLDGSSSGRVVSEARQSCHACEWARICACCRSNFPRKLPIYRQAFCSFFGVCIHRILLERLHDLSSERAQETTKNIVARLR